MLTLEECREYLDEDTSKSLSDEEVTYIRDQMYSLARLVLSTQQKNEQSEEVHDEVK